MQNYMISTRKKNGVFPTETVEDRAAKDFRDMVRKRGERQKDRKTGSLMYVASACLVLVLIVMGVSMVNSFDRMKSVQNTLDTLVGTTDTVETQETSGTVTAVTEEQAGDGQAGDEAQTEPDAEKDVSDAKDAGETTAAGTNSSDQDTVLSAGNSDGSGTAGITESGTSGGQTLAVTEGNGSDGVYIVEEGDTLAIISRKMYGDVTHVDAICRMNGITDGNLIYVGQKLLLP